MNVPSLPQQFKSPDFRFLRVETHSKKPIDLWKDKKTHLKYDDKTLSRHLEEGGNVGILGGYGNLVVVDCDLPELALELEKKLPETLTEKSAKGIHKFYIAKMSKEKKFITLDVGKKHYGEIRADREHQTVISPSIHPTGAKYIITKNVAIAQIEEKTLLEAIAPFIPQKVSWDKVEESGLNFDIARIVNIEQMHILSNGEYQGAHPVHGSTTGVNFMVNPEKNVWHCFRHACGGTALHLVAMKENIIECGQKLSGKFYNELIRISKEKYGIDMTEIYKEATKPMNYEQLKDILSMTIKEDDANKIITFIGMLLAYTERSQINIFNRAPSSTGKSYIPLEIAAFFPKKDVITVGYCSPTAFFHDADYYDAERKLLVKDLSRKILIFLDMPHDDLLRRLRPLLSHDEKEMLIKITDRREAKGMRTKNVIVIGFPSVVFCTASMRMDEQEATRAFILSPETSEEKIRAALEIKTIKEGNIQDYNKLLNSDRNREYLKMRIKLIRTENIDNIVLEENLYKYVKKKFSTEKKLKPRHPRDMERLFSLIRGHTLLNLWHRKKNDEGFYLSNEEDIKNAFIIWDEIAKIQERGISPYLYRLFEELFLKLSEERPEGFYKKDIQRKHWELYDRGIPSRTLDNEIIPTLEGAGLILLEPDPNDKRKSVIIVNNILNNNIDNDKNNESRGSEIYLSQPCGVTGQFLKKVESRVEPHTSVLNSFGKTETDESKTLTPTKTHNSYQNQELNNESNEKMSQNDTKNAIFKILEANKVQKGLEMLSYEQILSRFDEQDHREVRIILVNMVLKGELFEPKPGFLRKP